MLTEAERIKGLATGKTLVIYLCIQTKTRLYRLWDD